MKYLLTIILGLVLSMPTFGEENLNNSDDTLAKTDSETYEITLNDDKSSDELEALVQTYFYNFGRTRLFRIKSISFDLRNRRFVPIRINNIHIFGNGFFQRENCPEYLFFGQRCTIRIFFRPNYVGFFNGRLIVNLSGAESIRVFLSGRGIFNEF